MPAGPPFTPRILYNLIEPETVDISLDLDPDREVVGHLEGKFGPAVVLAGEEFVDARVVDKEIEGAAVVREIFRNCRHVQDLIVAGIKAEIRAFDQPVASLELHERLRDFQPVTNECAEDRIGGLGRVEVAHDEQVVVFDEFLLKAGVDPIGEELQLGGAGFDAVAPAGVCGDGEEVEVAGAKGAHVGCAPEGLAGQIFLGLLGARGVDLGGEAVVDDGAAIEEEGDTFLVPAAVVDPIGVNDPPLGAEIAKDAAEIGEVVAQLDDGDEVELARISAM